MEIDLTTVTANKKWSQALSRIRPITKDLEDSIKLLEIDDEYCEILQVIFEDYETEEKAKEDGFVKILGERAKDRSIIQIIMITPKGFSFEVEEDNLLFNEILSRTNNGVRRTKMKEENKEKIIRLITQEINNRQ